MAPPTIYADFNNADANGRVRLNCAGTVSDLSRLGVVLREGMAVVLSDDDLAADGRVEFSADERIWVAAVDWTAVRPSAGEPVEAAPQTPAA